MSEHDEIAVAIQHAQDVADREGCTECGNEHRQLAGWLRRLVQMEHDFQTLSEFHRRHALGPMMPPKCLICNQQTGPKELDVPCSVAFQHAELPGIVVCKRCYEAATRSGGVTKDQTDIPTLVVAPNGSSGIEIRALLGEKYDCAEFTLRADVPQPVFISPWMQFEPVKMKEQRLKIAYEIVRRAQVHELLLSEIDTLQSSNKNFDFVSQRRAEECRDREDRIFALWRVERVKHGLPEDFSDVDFSDFPPP